MNPFLLYAALAVFAAFSAGVPIGIEWERGREAERKVDTMMAQKIDSLKWARAVDAKTLPYILKQKTIEKELQNARVEIQSLSRVKSCLGAPTVRMLNSIDLPAASTPAATPASAPATVAAFGYGYASERSAAEQIAQCRGGYKSLAAQLSEILDFEDMRDAQERLAK